MSNIFIREARQEEFNFIEDLMDTALSPYYGGDHRAHAGRIFSTHISGGIDQIGHFSFEQKMFIAQVDRAAAGMIHIVGKRQGTYKISPIIVAKDYRGKLGIGSSLLEFVENYAITNNARQIYCTVAEENDSALQFFKKNGYIVAGKSKDHYKIGITEIMLYKPLIINSDIPNIVVVPCLNYHKPQARQLILDILPKYFFGLDDRWVDALFKGYERQFTNDINVKYKLIYVAVDSDDNVQGVVGATPKKGGPIKIMPFVASTEYVFGILLQTIPVLLEQYGHKFYIHIVPSVGQTIELQKSGWTINCLMPAAYHTDYVTQQWSIE